jgi:hypothetical protein
MNKKDKVENKVEEFIEIWDKQIFPHIEGLIKQAEGYFIDRNISDQFKLITFNCDKPNELHCHFIWIQYYDDASRIAGIRQITYTNKLKSDGSISNSTVIYIEELSPLQYSHDVTFSGFYPEAGEFADHINWLCFFVDDIPEEFQGTGDVLYQL